MGEQFAPLMYAMAYAVADHGIMLGCASTTAMWCTQGEVHLLVVSITMQGVHHPLES